MNKVTTASATVFTIIMATLLFHEARLKMIEFNQFMLHESYPSERLIEPSSSWFPRKTGHVETNYTESNSTESNYTLPSRDELYRIDIQDINDSEAQRYISLYPGLRKSETGWHLYRLSDMFKDEKFSRMKGGFQWHFQHFPTSIATQYLLGSNITGFKNDTALLRIVQDRTKPKQALIPSEDTLVVHLRTGDVIWRLSKSFTMTQILRTEQNASSPDNCHFKFVKGFPYYEPILAQLRACRCKRALFVTGSHRFKGAMNNNILYIINMMKFFEKYGYHVSLRINENPDDDVILMSNSKYFVQSGGGFSRVIATLVKLMGGYVYPCLNGTTCDARC